MPKPATPQRRQPLTEAQSLDERLRAVRDAIYAKMMPQPKPMPEMAEGSYCEVEEIYDDFAIVEQGKKKFKVAYSVAANGTVTLKDPVEVEETYVPVKESSRPAAAIEPTADPSNDGAPLELTEAATILEARDAHGRVWDALLIKAGTSGNKRHYPASVLRESAPKFEGTKAFADHPAKGDRPERSIRDVVGWFDGVHWDDGKQGIRGSFHVLESADWLRQSLKSAWDGGKSDLFGFSINAHGRPRRQPHSDGSQFIESIDVVHSTDVVTVPGAGGYPLGILESLGDADVAVTAEEIKAMIAEALAANTATLVESFKQAQPAAAPLTADADKRLDELQGAADRIAEFQDGEGRLEKLNESVRVLQEAEKAAAARVQLAEQKTLVREKIDAAGLPPGPAGRVRTKLLETVERRFLEESEIDAEIGFAREFIRESGPPQVSWDGARATIGDDFKDKFNKGVQGFFEGQDIDGVKRFPDLHRMAYTWQSTLSPRGADPFTVNAYSIMEALGSSAMKGRHEAGDGYSVGLLESLTTASWGEVFGDNLYKMTMKQFNDAGKYGTWRRLVSKFESVPSFQTRHVHRIGGYADLAPVAEQGTYQPFASPTDEEATYALAKYGNLEDLTFEMLQDPTAASDIQSMPLRMARAAHRTLYKFVFNTILRGGAGVGMTATYDSTAVFTTGHANLITSAGLSVGKLQTGRQAMRDQTAYNEASEVLGELNEPRILLVPNELQGIADRLISGADAYNAAIASSTDTDQALDPNLFKGRLEVIVVDIWTDANDWILVADPRSVETIVMGFLNGREEPEIFVQDNPTTGSVFTADKISYKIRSIFSGTMLEHRSFLLAQG